ncbi:hypothetical protein [Acidithiobacillus ferrooxidans]|nr:hypothetical protein [Acidithiobacillus ferrooxidans]MBU2817944.1 hypothetical protein [Acidithiobacillus ferrooxidans]MCR1342812.1 hypothetical protein [Acidithiobacillus ferrooxidans]QZT53867.1 hypothetical protein K7B00_06845 [Acidithiobacillus ferrooxidans]BDB14056.1 hypothetical protein ANFP_13760 [Acidithiobacillus ferrooxidans]
MSDKNKDRWWRDPFWADVLVIFGVSAVMMLLPWVPWLLVVAWRLCCLNS